MAYYDNQSRYVEEVAVTLQASATKTTTGTSTGVLLGRQRSLSLVLAVTAVSSPTTLDVVVQTSNDNSTWRTFMTFTQVTTGPTSSQRLSAGGADKYLRLSYTIAGTSYTFSVLGIAV